MSARWPPLVPEFVVARGAAGRALAQSLLAAPERLATLRGVVSGEVLAVTGVELPWVDGAEYFGRESAGAWLFVPTQRALEVPASWLERRYRRALPAVAWPCLLLFSLSLRERVGVRALQSLLPVGSVAAFDVTALSAWVQKVAPHPDPLPAAQGEGDT